MAGIALPTAQSLAKAYDVRVYGATGKGVTDDTAAIQAALNAAGATNIGAVCYCPPGTYLIAGQLNVPTNVQLVGSFSVSPTFTNLTGVGYPPPGSGGTAFAITGNAGSAGATAAITLNWNSTLRGVLLYYPNQSTTAVTPTAYPYAIAMATNSEQARVLDCCLLNPYQGIYINAHPRGTVYRVVGQPLSIGLKVESTSDISRLYDVHWVPIWITGNPLTWQQANGTGFAFGRSDEQYCVGLFAYGYNIGCQLYNQTSGIGTGQTYGTFLGCSIDSCNTSISAYTSYQGVNWIGGGIASLNTNVSMTNGALSMTNVRFWSSGTPNFSHTGGVFSMSQCYIQSQMAITASGTVFSFCNNTLASNLSTIALSGTGKATLVGNTGPVGTAFSSMVSGTMSGGTVTAGNN